MGVLLGQLSIPIKNLQLVVHEDGVDFPKSFSLSVNEQGHKLDGHFEILDNYESPPISVLENGKARQVEFSHFEKHQIYREKYGRGFATLIDNKNKIDRNHRVFARIFSEINHNDHYDIVHVPKKNGRLGHLTYEHLLQKRVLNDLMNSSVNFEKVKDYKIIPEDYHSKKKDEVNKNSRAVNGEPIVADVETLVVVDPSIYEDHKEFLQTNDQEIIFDHIRLYYAHTMNGVNDKYQNSMTTDPDLRINIKLVHILILTDPNVATWTRADKVGDTEVTDYNGRQVILADETLEEFGNFLQGQTFDFEYDHAVGVFNKDLFTGDKTLTNELRSGVVGYAWVGGACTISYRTSVQEDIGGFYNVYVIAHEIGHNLGAAHDGTGNSCQESDRFIMSASLGFSNIENIQKFSPCSLAYFKEYILENNGPISSEASCLSNINNNFPDFVKNANTSLTGQIWDLNDQCKTVFGSSASFCQIFEDRICSNLFCRQDVNSTCSSKAPAAEGSTCASGSKCTRGLCTPIEGSLESVCPFGDDYVRGTYYSWIPYKNFFSTCEEYFDILHNMNYSVQFFCSEPFGKSSCCSSCLKYDYINCTDDYLECPSWKNICAGGYIISPDNLVKDRCRLTCGTCSHEPLNCQNNVELCKNGGICKNEPLTKDGLIGFSCECKSGFSGKICETKLDLNLKYKQLFSLQEDLRTISSKEKVSTKEMENTIYTSFPDENSIEWTQTKSSEIQFQETSTKDKSSTVVGEITVGEKSSTNPQEETTTECIEESTEPDTTMIIPESRTSSSENDKSSTVVGEITVGEKSSTNPQEEEIISTLLFNSSFTNFLSLEDLSSLSSSSFSSSNGEFSSSPLVSSPNFYSTTSNNMPSHNISIAEFSSNQTVLSFVSKYSDNLVQNDNLLLKCSFYCNDQDDCSSLIGFVKWFDSSKNLISISSFDFSDSGNYLFSFLNESVWLNYLDDFVFCEFKFESFLHTFRSNNYLIEFKCFIDVENDLSSARIIQDSYTLIFNEDQTKTSRLSCFSTIPITCNDPSRSDCSLKFSLQYKNLFVNIDRVIVKECYNNSIGVVTCNPDDKSLRPSKDWNQNGEQVIWDIGVSLEAKNRNFREEIYELEIVTNKDSSDLRPFFQNFKIPSIKVKFIPSRRSLNNYATCFNDPHCMTFDRKWFEFHQPGEYQMYENVETETRIHLISIRCSPFNWNFPGWTPPYCLNKIYLQYFYEILKIDVSTNMIFYSDLKRNILDEPLVFDYNNQIINELDSLVIKKSGYGLEITTGYGLVLRVYGYVWFYRLFINRFDIIPAKGDRGNIDGIFYDWNGNRLNDLSKLKSGEASSDITKIFDSYQVNQNGIPSLANSSYSFNQTRIQLLHRFCASLRINQLISNQKAKCFNGRNQEFFEQRSQRIISHKTLPVLTKKSMIDLIPEHFISYPGPKISRNTDNIQAKNESCNNLGTNVNSNLTDQIDLEKLRENCQLDISLDPENDYTIGYKNDVNNIVVELATNDASNMEVSEDGTLAVSIDLKQMCSNDCSGHGTCSNLGVCECEENYVGADCSSFIFDVPELIDSFSNYTWDLSQNPFEDLIFGAIKFILSNTNSSLRYAIYYPDINNLTSKGFISPLQITYSSFYANFSAVSTPKDYFFTEIQLTNDGSIFSNSSFITAADLRQFFCSNLNCVPLNANSSNSTNTAFASSSTILSETNPNEENGSIAFKSNTILFLLFLFLFF